MLLINPFAPSRGLVYQMVGRRLGQQGMGDRRSPLIGKELRKVFSMGPLWCWPCASVNVYSIALNAPYRHWNSTLPQLTTSILISFLHFLSYLKRLEPSSIWIPTIHYLYHSFIKSCLYFQSWACCLVVSAPRGLGNQAGDLPRGTEGRTGGSEKQWLLLVRTAPWVLTRSFLPGFYPVPLPFGWMTCWLWIRFYCPDGPQTFDATATSSTVSLWGWSARWAGCSGRQVCAKDGGTSTTLETTAALDPWS